MEAHKEEYFKTLDKLELLLETHKNTISGEFNKIASLFKSEINPNANYAEIEKYLSDLSDTGTVKIHPQQNNNASKYSLIRKHHIGHYKDALEKEIDANKLKDEQKKEKEKASKKLDKDLLIAERSVKWFYPLLFVSFIGLGGTILGIVNTLRIISQDKKIESLYISIYHSTTPSGQMGDSTHILQTQPQKK